LVYVLKRVVFWWNDNTSYIIKDNTLINKTPGGVNSIQDYLFVSNIKCKEQN